MSLNNYNGIANLKKHMHNMHGPLELIIQNSDSMYKIFLTILRGPAHVWHNNLEPGSVKKV